MLIAHAWQVGLHPDPFKTLRSDLITLNSSALPGVRSPGARSYGRAHSSRLVAEIFLRPACFDACPGVCLKQNKT